LSANDLTRITSNFPAKITNTDTLSFENLTVVVNGRGTFTECNMAIDAGKISLLAYGSNVGNHVFKGKADNLNVVTEGLTTVDASELAAQNVSVVQKSVNSSEVNAVSKLLVNMLSSGNIYYTGDPEISMTEGKPLYDVELGNVIHLSE
jgi:microcompartment protein CcmL/EutN